MKMRWGFFLLGLLASAAYGQTELTLQEALQMARMANGNVRSAALDYESSRAVVRASRSAFYPTVTPSVSKQFGEAEYLTGPFRGSFGDDSLNAQVDLNWRLIDTGQRSDNVRRSMLSAEIAAIDASSVLKDILRDVHVRFFEALRAQELVRVQLENLKRAEVIRDQTRIRANPPIEDIPRKDILQAEADYQNARVSVLSAETRVAGAEADLKEILGYDQGELPRLVPPTEQELPPLDLTLQEAIDLGLRRKGSLRAYRLRLESQEITIRSTRREGELDFAVDANYRRIFTDDPFQRAALVFSASLPVYDGERVKSLTQAERLTLESMEATYEQNVRVARADIEATYKEYEQNRARREAARLALVAAQENYNAAVEAQREGAGNLLEVLTAQVSLTTAESNLVEAIYDLLITDIRFKRLIGEPIPGQETP